MLAIKSKDEDRIKRQRQEFPLVSIIVLNWNGERVIRSSLNSIRKLDYPNTEAIVVDNGSTDTSIDMIVNEFPDFRLVKNERNLGFSAGMNVGIRESRGDLVLLYNNDAIAHPKSLSAMVKTILSEDGTAVVGGLILYDDPKDVIESRGGRFDLITGVIWAEGNGERLRTGYLPDERLVTDLEYVSGCVLLIRKEAIQKIGLFDEQVVLWSQDLDWCLKAKRAGFKCVLNPSAMIWHIGSYSSRRTPSRSYSGKLKSDIQVIMLHFPIIPMLSALLFQALVAPFFDALVFRQKGMGTSSRLQARVRAFGESLKDIRAIAFKRKQIAALGALRLRPRTLELVRFVLFRIRASEFYMGKLLQESE